MTAVSAEGPGRFATHFTFSVFEKVAGNPVSAVEPLKDGPRHCGQFSPRADREATAIRLTKVKRRAKRLFPWFIVFPAPGKVSWADSDMRRRITGGLCKDKADSQHEPNKVVRRLVRSPQR